MKSLINRRAARVTRNFHRHKGLVLTTPDRLLQIISTNEKGEVLEDDIKKQHNDISAKS